MCLKKEYNKKCKNKEEVEKIDKILHKVYHQGLIGSNHLEFHKLRHNLENNKSLLKFQIYLSKRIKLIKKIR